MKLKIVWINPETPVKSEGRWAVKCEVCGKMGLPFPPWIYREIPVGWDYQGYEQPFYICSEKCDENSKIVFEAKQRQLNMEFGEIHGEKMPKWLRDILKVK